MSKKKSKNVQEIKGHTIPPLLLLMRQVQSECQCAVIIGWSCRKTVLSGSVILLSKNNLLTWKNC